MINYTDDEILFFLSNFTLYVVADPNATSLNKGFLFIDYKEAFKTYHTKNIFFLIRTDGILYQISLRIFMKIFKDDSFGEDLYTMCLNKTPQLSKDYIDSLIRVLRTMELEELPPYLVSYSQIVSWRLRIGK